MPQKTIFFSYARTDSDFVKKLAQDLRENGVRIWLDQLDIKPGSHWDQSIEDALTAAGRIMVILSDDSVSSKNVMDEVSFALEEGKEVIPLLLRPTSIPFRLRRVQHVDFTQNYNDAFKSLLRALKSDEELGVVDAHTESKAQENTIKPVADTKKQSVAKEQNLKVGKPEKDQPFEISNKKSMKIPIAIAAFIVITAFVVMFGGLVEFDGSPGNDNPDREEILWNEARSQNTIASIEHYIEKFPDSRYAASARQRLNALKGDADLEDWHTARQQNTIAAYQSYLDKYPDGAQSGEAKKMINALSNEEENENAQAVEEKQWQLAQNSQSIGDYRDYLNNYPNGRYTGEARNQMNVLIQKQREADKQLADQQGWEYARSLQTIAGYENYIKSFPDGAHVRDAQELIRIFTQKKDIRKWRETVKHNSVQAYQEYMRLFPNGSYYQEAKKRIAELQGDQSYANFYKTFNGNWYNMAGTWLYGIGANNSKTYIRTNNIFYYYGKDDVKLLSNGVYEVKTKSSSSRRNFYFRRGNDTNSMYISGSATGGFNAYWKVVGRSVTRVTHSNGSFEISDGKIWYERDKNGRAMFSFTETARDDWSVYMRDNKGRGNLQIDIYRKMTVWTPTNGKRQDLYKLTGWYNK